MTQYLLIESRDPYAHAVAEHAELAVRLKQAGNAVTVFLVQNGVLPVRAQAQDGALARLADAHVDVLADEFSLRERVIAPNDVRPGVRVASLEVVIDRLLAGWKVIWH